MRNKEKVSIVLIINVLLLLSCNVDKKQAFTTISIFDLKKADFQLNSIRVVALETTDSCLLGEKNRLIQVDDSDIFIGDLSKMNKKIFRFGSDGQFKNSIGQRGKGTKEYIDLTDFTIADNVVSVLSFNGERAEIFNYQDNGKFVSRMPINIGATSFMRIGSSYLFLIGNRPDLCSYRLYLTDLKGKTLASFLPYKGIAYQKLGSFTKVGSSVLLRQNLDRYVYKYEGEKIRKTYAFNFGKYAIPKSYYESLNSVTYITEFAKLQENGYAEITQYFETPKYIVFEATVNWGFETPYQIEYLVIDKNSQQIKRYSCRSDNRILGTLVGVNKKDELIFKVDAIAILDNKNKFDKLPILNRQNLQGLKVSDNPVLFYCTLK